MKKLGSSKIKNVNVFVKPIIVADQLEYSIFSDEYTKIRKNVAQNDGKFMDT